MREKTDNFIPTRQSLLSRLKSWDDRESWRDFFDTYGRLIFGLAVKSGLTDAEAQDVVQETCLSVAKQMPGFKYDPSIGSFKGWLLQITRRRIVDQLRSRIPASPVALSSAADPDGTAMIEGIPDPAGAEWDAVWENEWQRNLLDQAIGRIKRRISPKQFQMFDLYVTQEWPMDLVTSTLGVNAAQVYMAKMRVGRLIKKEIESLEAKPG